MDGALKPSQTWLWTRARKAVLMSGFGLAVEEKSAKPVDTTPKMTSEAEELMKSVADLLKKKRLRASDLFKKIDSSGDGNVTGEELRAGLSDLGFKLSDADLQSIMSVIDKDGGGEVSVKEFDRAMRAAEKLPAKKEKKDLVQAPVKKRGITEQDKEEMRQIFCLFKQLSQARSAGLSDDNIQITDWNEQGSIGVDDLEQLLETVGLKLSPLQMDALMAEIDVDGDGEINFAELCTSMARKMQIDYEPEDVTQAFRAFARNAPDGLIRVHDLREALRTYMHAEISDSQVEELLQHYQDCFVTTPDSQWEYFKYQSYIDMMSPLADRAGPSGDA